MIKKREAKVIVDKIKDLYDCKLPERLKVEKGKLIDLEVILINDSIDFIVYGEKFLFTLPSIEKYEPRKKFVVIDMGAVKFVANGADVMAPGIVEADPDIKEGDPVWVRDEKHGKGIATGISLMDGNSLVNMEKGRGVKNVHFIGDKIWRFISKSL